MTSMRCSDPFCDWLDVTFSPEDAPDLAVHDLLMAACAWPLAPGLYRLGDRGTVKVQPGKRFVRVSASGSALRYLEGVGRFVDFLCLLGSQPHRVTRVDAAMDTDEEGPEAVERYRALYPQTVQLSHKPIKVSCMLSHDAFGRETGTWYAGHRSAAKVTARVYDKAHQMMERYGELHGPWTRYEVTARGDVGPTLRDAYDPEALFWHYASPALLERPEGAPEWRPGAGEGWVSSWKPPTPAAILKDRVGASPELGVLIELADKAGPRGRDYLLSLLRRRIEGAIAA